VEKKGAGMKLFVQPKYLAYCDQLTHENRKRIRETEEKIQSSPTLPGLHIHPVMNELFAISVTEGIRIIAQKTDEGLVLHYVASHEKAYRWAEEHHAANIQTFAPIERLDSQGSVDLIEQHRPPGAPLELVKSFKDFDQETNNAYSDWLLTHPSGFVLNIGKPITSAPVKLHKARCAFIMSSRFEPFIGEFFYKICSDDIDALRQWSRQEGQEPNDCKICKPA